LGISYNTSCFCILQEKSQELSNGSFQIDVIALNNEVERISLNDQDSSVMVECSNGRRIRADHVIITVSVGVLREIHAKLFENMPIPEMKIHSINVSCKSIYVICILHYDMMMWNVRAANAKNRRVQKSNTGRQKSTGE